jgi:hypothetical protein
MFTTGAKFWAAVTGVAALAFVAYVITSDFEKIGTYTLIGLVLSGLVLTVVHVVSRDGELAVLGVTDPQPAAGWARPPAVPWPAFGALGGALVLAGLAVGSTFVVIGLAVLFLTVVEWMVQGWAERATSDPATNRELRNGFMYPVEVPLAAFAVVALIVLAFSRVLLALPKNGSVVIAIVLAAVVLAVATLLSSRPRLPSSLIAGVVVLGAIGLLAGGIAAAVVGERDIEHHEVESDARILDDRGVDLRGRTELGPVDVIGRGSSDGDGH